MPVAGPDGLDLLYAHGCVSVSVVVRFLDAVEAGAVPEVDTLRGGEAALWVGEQQEDGGEMDVLKLIERSEAQAEADEAKARGRPQGPGRGPFQH